MTPNKNSINKTEDAFKTPKSVKICTLLYKNTSTLLILWIIFKIDEFYSIYEI